jgi:hypothetical protein
VKINPALEIKFYQKDDDGGAESAENKNIGNSDENTVNDKIRQKSIFGLYVYHI